MIDFVCLICSFGLQKRLFSLEILIKCQYLHTLAVSKPNRLQDNTCNGLARIPK